MASTPAAKARTELNVAIGYVDRATHRLAREPAYQHQATPWSASAPSWPTSWPS
jgi:hypothetical protein